MAKDRRGGKPEWYPLDNAGVLYSAIQKENYSAIYRFSAVMAAPVDPDALQRAVERTMPRFPSFAVRIKRGGVLALFRAQPCRRSLREAGYRQSLPAGALPGGQRLAGAVLLL